MRKEEEGGLPKQKGRGFSLSFPACIAFRESDSRVRYGNISFSISHLGSISMLWTVWRTLQLSTGKKNKLILGFPNSRAD